MMCVYQVGIKAYKDNDQPILRTCLTHRWTKHCLVLSKTVLYRASSGGPGKDLCVMNVSPLSSPFTTETCLFMGSDLVLELPPNRSV